MLSCNKSNELNKNYFVYNIRLNNMADTLQPTFLIEFLKFQSRYIDVGSWGSNSHQVSVCSSNVWRSRESAGDRRFPLTQVQ